MGILNFFGHTRQARAQLEAKWHQLYRIAFAWCHDPHLAMDLVQDTLTKALDRRHQLRNPEAENTWLYTILVNCWRDYCRQRRTMEELDDEALSHHDGPETENSRVQVFARVRRAMQRLSDDQREILTLVALDGMSYEEAAKTLEVPIGTVMSRLCRARRTLRRYLHDVDTLVIEPASAVRRVK